VSLEATAARFIIDVGSDEKTGDKVAAVVRDDGVFLNLQLIDALMELGQLFPETCDHICDVIYSLVDSWEERGKA
jgi:hypothetical protein